MSAGEFGVDSSMVTDAVARTDSDAAFDSSVIDAGSET